MRLIIEKVHLKNFRIHDDYVFTPSTDGVTAIIGDNGHGKSSIIDGIAWALYGTKPNGSVKNSALRKIGSQDSSECFVDVLLRIDGDQKLRVKRSIKGKNTVQCECWIDDVLEAGPSVSHADKWIPSMLGIDEEGFLSAVLVQQKQVGAIVSESASIRQQNIEKLTGITAATNAVKNAREEANSLKKAIKIIAPEASNIDDTKNDISKLEKKLEDIRYQRNALKAKLDETNKEYKKNKELLDGSASAYDEKNALLHDYDIAKQHLKDMDNRRCEMADKISAMRGKLPSITDYEPLQHEYDDISQRLRKLQAEDQVLSGIIADDVEDKAIADAKQAIEKATIPDMDRDDAVMQLDTLKSNVSGAQQRIRQYRKSIEGLSSDNRDDNVVCPTCLQPIDDIEHVRQEFHNMIDAATQDIGSGRKSISAIERSLAEYDAAVQSLNECRSMFDSMIERRNKAEEARKRKDIIAPDIKSLSHEIGTVSGKISDIKANRMIIETYNNYKHDYESANTQYDSSAKQVSDIKKRLDGIDAPSESALEKIRSKSESLKDSLNSITSKAIALKGENQLISERLENANNTLSKALEQEKERNRIMHKYSVSQASLSVLSAFREHLAKEAVPQITDYASDMISSITDGKFISVMIDEKYSIYVKRNDGNILEVKMLSGGERDTVAICLRLAISMMLSAGDPSMIILDEVLTAMDDSRASAILNAIQESGHGQVIIIAHNDIIKQISDKAVLL